MLHAPEAGAISPTPPGCYCGGVRLRVTTLLVFVACGDSVPAEPETASTAATPSEVSETGSPPTATSQAQTTGETADTNTGAPPTGSTDQGTSSDTDTLPDGCGDGIPQTDVACYTRVVFPDIRGGARRPADFNGDGAIDLALLDDDVMRIAVGDGHGVLTHASDIPLGEPTISIEPFHAADIDGDADIDLAIAIQGELFTLINDGAAQFTLQKLPTFIALDQAAFFDTNADAITDLVANSNLSLKILPGPDFAFAPYTGAVTPCYGSALARIDFDQDAFDDLLVASSCNDPPPNSPVRVYLGTGQATFTDGIQVLVGSDAIAFTVSDFNGDQRDDFATLNQYGDDISLVLRTDAGFADEHRIGDICPACSNLHAIAPGDFDGTGFADEIVVAVTTELTVSLYLLMNPVEDAPLHGVALAEDTTRLIAVADWNGDGITDVAAATPDGELALVLFLSTP